MSHLPLSFVVLVICRWIDSCETLQQVFVCEQLIDRYVFPRLGEDSSGLLIATLKKHLQMRQVYAQCMCSEKRHLIEQKYGYIQ